MGSPKQLFITMKNKIINVNKAREGYMKIEKCFQVVVSSVNVIKK